MKEEKHVQVGSKERIGDVWYFSANTYSNGGGYGHVVRNFGIMNGEIKSAGVTF